MLASFTVSFMVLITVILTLIDIIGFLHFWNITIDIFSASGAVLSIGLCVDYAVHLGLAFIIAKGGNTNFVYIYLKSNCQCQAIAPNSKEVLKCFVLVYKLGHGRAVFGSHKGDDGRFFIKEINKDLRQIQVIFFLANFNLNNTKTLS